jgi:TonB family protein
VLKYLLYSNNVEKVIDDQRKAKTIRAAIFAFSLLLHGILFFFALTIPINVRILNFNEKRTDAVLVPPPRIKYTGVPAVSPPGPKPTAGRPSAGRPSAGGQRPDRPLTEEEQRSAGGEGRRTSVPPLGGISGTVIGGGGGGRGLSDREREESIASGFSLVFPSDAMINLAKYAQVPEDAWLQPYRPRTKSLTDFSAYLHPPSGTRGTAIAGPVGKIPGGGIGTAKTPPSGVVAAFVPEDVKTFDLSGWANEVLNVVQKNWTLGADAGAAEWSGQVTLTILVMKAGDIVDIEVIASSNIDPLDKSVRRAVDRSGPWPPLPPGFPETSLELQLVFRYGR